MQELITYKKVKTLNNLKTKYLGRNYICFKEIDSTQKEIWRRIETNKIINGLLIKAEKQLSGIGTHGRKWVNTENNIAFSFYMELNCDIKKLNGLTVKIAEIIVETINEMYSIRLQIKLPNDIYYNDKKIGGILTETKTKGNIVKFIVIGVGINNGQIEFDEELNNIASSIKKEFGIEIDDEKFISNLCNKFEKNIFSRIEDEKK